MAGAVYGISGISGTRINTCFVVVRVVLTFVLLFVFLFSQSSFSLFPNNSSDLRTFRGFYNSLN